MKKGVPVSPGVAVAHAHCVEEVITSHEPYTQDDASLSGEVNRFERACAAASREIEETISRVSRQIGDEEAAIFRAHRQLLRDPTMIGKVRARICEQRIDSSSALQQTFEEYAALFRQISDPYLQDRLSDLRDVVGRIITHLNDEPQKPALEVQEPVILVIPEIFPSQASLIDKRWVALTK